MAETVFVASHGYEYEGEEVVGVGLTFEQASALLGGVGGDSVDIREYEPGVPDPVSEYTRSYEGAWRRKVFTDPTGPYGGTFEWVTVGPVGV